MNINIITALPEIFESCQYGILGQALKKGILTTKVTSIRDFSPRTDRRIDDRPYGGGPGMVLEPQPVFDAIDDNKAYTIELSPQGKPLTQDVAKKLATKSNITLLCGRYEGIDHRVTEYIDEKISIGDYILSGGDLPALVLIDSIVRLLPGALSCADSASQDSFEDGLLDHPHYTRPYSWKNKQVPDVLLSGNHKDITAYRMGQSLGYTWLNRPDLLIGRTLSDSELKLLAEFLHETPTSS